MSLTHGRDHAVLPRGLHITRFHGTLHGYVVILAKQTAHAESHNLLTDQMSTIRERRWLPRPLPDIHRRHRTLWAANPLWRKHTQQLEVIVSSCKQGRAYLRLWVTFHVFDSRASWLGDYEEGQEAEVTLGSPGMDPWHGERKLGRIWGSKGRVDSLGITVRSRLVRGNILLVFCWHEVHRILNTLKFNVCLKPE